jgi:hypothetical protein
LKHGPGHRPLGARLIPDLAQRLVHPVGTHEGRDANGGDKDNPQELQDAEGEKNLVVIFHRLTPALKYITEGIQRQAKTSAAV